MMGGKNLRKWYLIMALVTEGVAIGMYFISTYLFVVGEILRSIGVGLLSLAMWFASTIYHLDYTHLEMEEEAKKRHRELVEELLHKKYWEGML